MTDGQSTPIHGELTFAEAVDRRMGMSEQPPEKLGAALEDSSDNKASLEEAATEETVDESMEVEETQDGDDDGDEEEQDESLGDDEVDENTTEDDEDEEDEEPEEAVYTIEIDGERHEVTLEELKRGHLRESDYTRKTQDLAAQRKHVEEEGAQLRQSLEATAVIMNSALTASGDELAKFQNIDWQALQSEDAYEFGQQYAAYQLALAKREGLEQQASQLVHAQQQIMMESTAAKVAQEQQLLINALPDMADVQKGPALMQEIRSYATSTLGLADSEVDSITDHRVIVALNKARLYDAMDGKAKSIGAKKRSKAPSKSVKPGAPHSKSRAQSAKSSQLKERAKQTGSVDDAVARLLASRNIL